MLKCCISPKRNAAFDGIKSKRNAAFDGIKSSSEDDPCLSPIGIHTFCHTWWTVRGDAIESILVNYSILKALWEECLQSQTRLDPDVKARIIGVQSQMSTFNLFFWLEVVRANFENYRQPEQNPAENLPVCR